ncbi:TetR/AcrR family transcriptional regulator [Nonomuraea jabiensis]|uniref:TetR/AcrR family transcriptional regulator n=1 Tax=Nonomuraea jabiensis TaxID=882448 RepID=UPI003426EF68
MARDPATDIDALVTASARVFARKGYRNATIDDIAEAAKISRPTVYKYTKSKQQLLDLMVDHITSYLGRRADEAMRRDAPPVTRLAELLRLHVEAACRNREFYLVALRDEVELSPKARRQFRKWAHDVTSDLAQLIEACRPGQGLAKDVDATVYANLILSMTTALHTWYDPRGRVKENDLYWHLLRLVEHLAPGITGMIDSHTQAG